MIYCGISSKANFVLKLYAGIGNKAKKIKKVYVGINNKARIISISSNVSYARIIDEYKCDWKQPEGAESIGNYAIFAGGSWVSYGGEYSDMTRAFNTSLANVSIAKLAARCSEMASTTIGNYALFGPGRRDVYVNTVHNFVTAFNTSLSRSIVYTSNYRTGCKAVTNGVYAIIGPGQIHSDNTLTFDPNNNANGFNSSLARSTFTMNSTRYANPNATNNNAGRVGNYGIILGNQYQKYDTSTEYGYDIYLASVNQSLVVNEFGYLRTIFNYENTLLELPNYLVSYGDGYPGHKYSKPTQVINTSLVKSTLQIPSGRRFYKFDCINGKKNIKDGNTTSCIMCNNTEYAVKMNNSLVTSYLSGLPTYPKSYFYGNQIQCNVGDYNLQMYDFVDSSSEVREERYSIHCTIAIKL